MKIYEDEIKKKISLLLVKREQERMNQYKFDGVFIEKVKNILGEEDCFSKDSNKIEEKEERVELTEENK